MTASLLYHLCRVEDRNDPKMQKMRRYVKAFTKEAEKEKDQFEKTDTMKGSVSGTPHVRQKNSGKSKASLGWQMIRLSALGYEMEREYQGEDDDLKYV